jgi:hypothetical protein
MSRVRGLDAFGLTRVDRADGSPSFKRRTQSPFRRQAGRVMPCNRKPAAVMAGLVPAIYADEPLMRSKEGRAKAPLLFFTQRELDREWPGQARP